VRGGLTRRVVLASGVLVVLIGAAFSILLLAIADLRNASLLSTKSQQVLAVSNTLERLVLDVETGQRGFLITGHERFLQPWETARKAIPKVSKELVRLVGVPEQDIRAREITEAVAAYVRDYSIPLVDAARADQPYARSVAAAEEGKRRVDEIRAQFDAFIAAEHTLSAIRQARSDTAARRAITSAAAGLGGSIVLILLLSGYLTRAIVGPIRRTAAMAARLAAGDLSTRMPENESAEVGALERSFNTMASSLEDNRDKLVQHGLEQAALRRLATLVAEGKPPGEVFAEVAEQVGRVLHVDLAHVVQFMPDETVTVVASWNEGGDALPVGRRWTLDGRNISSMVLRTGGPARLDDYAEASGEIGTYIRGLGARSSVGSPIVVDGRLWGVMIASSRQTDPLPPEAESRISAFTEIVATAISNTQARADLAASRARIVAAADDTRRRIERDLHDGTQQRLVTVGLELRAIEATVPPEQVELRAELARVAAELGSAVEDLREFSHGIHPAILSEGGLGPALKALGRRSTIPVEVEANVGGRLPEHIEVAAYFVASEAIANAVKHSCASLVRIHLEQEDDDVLHLSIRDDGAGGADPVRGSGLTGLVDRVEAVGGTILITSPAGEGTSLTVELPLAGV
jgi:signal transduction histidine kinase